MLRKDTKERRTIMELYFTTREKTLLKPIPFLYVKPFAKPFRVPSSTFLLENHIITHNLLIIWFLNKLQNMILVEGFKLFFHCTNPLWCFITSNYFMEWTWFLLINVFCHFGWKNNKFIILLRWSDLSHYPISSHVSLEYISINL